MRVSEGGYLGGWSDIAEVDPDQRATAHPFLEGFGGLSEAGGVPGLVEVGDDLAEHVAT